MPSKRAAFTLTKKSDFPQTKGKSASEKNRKIINLKTSL